MNKHDAYNLAFDAVNKMIQPKKLLFADSEYLCKQLEPIIEAYKILKERNYVDNCIEYYGRLCDGSFYKNKTGYMGTTSDTFYPATKEQRDLLFEKMKEAGYEWDGEKKELKKIEHKTLDPDKVIEWLEDMLHASVGVIDKFKKDFKL